MHVRQRLNRRQQQFQKTRQELLEYQTQEAARPIPPTARLSLAAFSAKYLLAAAHDCSLIPLVPACDFHRDLCRELEWITLSPNRPHRTNWLAPRGSAKSSWGSFAFPIWCLAYGLEPVVMIVSETQMMARQLLRSIRQVFQKNEQLRRDIPGSAPGSLWQQDAIQLANGSMLMCVGTGGNKRGTKEGPIRPTLFVIDDCQSKEAIWSLNQRTRDWEWLTRDIIPMGATRANFVNLATALHRECIACKLAGENSTGWKTRTYRAIVQAPVRMDLWEVWSGLLHERRLGDGEEASEQAAARAKAYFEQNRVEMER